jgi:hypothetical protein
LICNRDSIMTDSAAKLVSYPTGMRGTLARQKVAKAWSSSAKVMSVWCCVSTGS